jgi:NhaP-type Na+/H+ or K+/H+ antiporter
MATPADGTLSPVTAIALVGALGVGAQWVAWRLRMPAIVLMLAAGVIVGPMLGWFDPARDIGPLTQPLIALAVAVILFEGGLTLNFHSLSDAARGVRRLVVVGAPLGWLLSTLALRWGAGLSWESSAVFGGILIVTGPTVIAPLLRQARLARRPAKLLQWEAIVNDPLGALAAVLAFEVVLVLNTSTSVGEAILALGAGVIVATVLGLASGWGVARSFRQGLVPEYMKIPALFVILIAIFAASDWVLHESGLLAVTIMGVVIANSGLASYSEIRRFKEQATVLLVSGVFILLAASLDFSELGRLDWRAAFFVALVVLVARPLTVFLSLTGTDLPTREKLLVALTGPRGVVLVAVAGLFGERLVELGVEDAGLIGPLAFVLVAATVVFHGFTLAPIARALGLTAGGTPGVLFVGGSRFSVALAQVLQKSGFPVLVADPNHSHLVRARAHGVPAFYGDILSESAERALELNGFETVVAVSDNDAYNTLVTTDLGPEFGRSNVFQIARAKGETSRHALPPTLGGRTVAGGLSYRTLNERLREGWQVAATSITEDYSAERWRDEQPDAVPIAVVSKSGGLAWPTKDEPLVAGPGSRLITLRPARTQAETEQADEDPPEADRLPD